QPERDQGGDDERVSDERQDAQVAVAAIKDGEHPEQGEHGVARDVRLERRGILEGEGVAAGVAYANRIAADFALRLGRRGTDLLEDALAERAVDGRAFGADEHEHSFAVAGGEIAGVELRGDAGVGVGEMLAGDAAKAERVVDDRALGEEIERRTENGAVGFDLRIDRLACEALGDLRGGVGGNVVEKLCPQHAREHLLRIDAAMYLADRIELRNSLRERVDETVQRFRRGAVDQDEQLVELAELADEAFRSEEHTD